MADNVVLQEAIDALRGENRTRARELLTELIKEDQSNADYWVWMSATMETAKERIYCLQTALKLDPENASAKRGLIMLGAIPADETVPPFSMNRPRTWEQNLLLAHEKPKLKGWAAVRASPITRLLIVILLVGGIGASIAFGFVIPAMERGPGFLTFTPGPSPTYTLTVTAIGGKPVTQAAGTPAGPLSDLLDAPYTPTPLYVEPQRSPLTADLVLQFNRAYAAGDYDESIALLQEITKTDPDAVFAYYYLGESYRLRGNPAFSQQYYANAVDKDPNFGAGYVGLARAQLATNPNANVIPLLDEAIRRDPNFGEAYLERAKVKIRDNDIQGAIADLGDANERMPNSPLVFYYLAQARLKEGEYELALNSAQRSNELDLTYLPTYLMIGQINAALKNYDEAGSFLTTYLTYQSSDLTTVYLLGQVQFENGQYADAIKSMDRIIASDRNRREPYLYRFLSNVELGDGDAADADIDRINAFYPDSFEVKIATVRLHLIQERYGSALQILELIRSLPETDEQKAQYFYWGAITYEEREEFKDAADLWDSLLELPAEAMTEEMRQTAQEHLLDIRTPTPSRTPTKTRTPTATQTPTRTATPTP